VHGEPAPRPPGDGAPPLPGDAFLLQPCGPPPDGAVLRPPVGGHALWLPPQPSYGLPPALWPVALPVYGPLRLPGACALPRGDGLPLPLLFSVRACAVLPGGAVRRPGAGAPLPADPFPAPLPEWAPAGG
ncbi:MAG TPA: hypothetical protein DHU56_15425, partial [Marinobacter sp.]|nr:hypothetical protein [Marinobacter sp.]